MSDSPPLHNRKHLKQRRQRLRNAATPAERALWSMLRKRQLGGRKFRRQHGIGPYIVDFYCPAEQLIIELDGAVHDDPARHEYDDERQHFLAEKGFTVLRFANEDVFEQPDMVCTAIAQHFGNV
jgi:very-short-patch-repair endonuclease